ncbi:MAG TPA: long-chain fatty acid--CoA ligase [Bacteroidales bacterium]|nr:long-chain fatty acid--CoA ligase [Bacteroidales bacterium]HPS61558.1 long-chain fatty acid--CoA ligase [Bacteroidales bacterium]
MKQATVEVTRIFDLLELFRKDYSTIDDLFNIKRNGRWVRFSAADFVRISREFSLGLLSMGVGKGTRIATVLNNCPEWNFIDMGILQVGAVQVPVYPTVSEDNYRYIFHDSEVDYIIVHDPLIYERVRNILPELDRLKGIFSLEEIEGVRSWTEILEQGRTYAHPEQLEAIKATILPGDLATIIYTSGTTGRPKGVMSSHNNFVTNYKALAEIPQLKTGDRALSFLPLCHVYERTAGYVYQSFGVTIYYVQNVDELGEYMLEIRPHGFASVPRVFEKIYNRIVAQGRKLPIPMKGLFFWALRQGHKFELDHARGWVYDIKLFLADLLVFRKWRKALGGELKFIVSGSASLHPRLARIFWAARIPVLEAYGLTETSPGVTCYRFEPGTVKFGTVGTLLTGNEMKIAGDGEILVRGPNVMLGYLNRPEKTAEAIDADGWFHTGDIGVIEEGKFLRITDRKKEIFKTSGGKYIAPQPIEQKIKESPFIEYIMVVGENRNYPAALIIPNFEFLRNWCEVKNIEFGSREKAVNNPRIIRRIRKEVERFNQDLGKTEKIKRIRLLDAEWTTESGEISPTLKLRRKFILEKYSKIIEETYRSSEFNYRID